MPEGMMGVPVPMPPGGMSPGPGPGAASLPPPPGGGGMSGDAFQQILMFLAGLGFGPLVQNIEKLRGPRQAKGKGGPQAPGPGASPLGPGGGGLPPQIAQLLAQRAALQR